MTEFAKLKKYIQEIDELKKLHWKNPKKGIWINKVLRHLKEDIGETYHDQFYSATHGRIIGVVGRTSEAQYQHEHLEKLEQYRNYLETFLEELEEEKDERSIKGDGKAIQEIIFALNTIIGIFSNPLATGKKIDEAVKLYESYWKVARNSFPNRKDIELLDLGEISVVDLLVVGFRQLTKHRKDLLISAEQLKNILEEETPNKIPASANNDIDLIDKICMNFHKIVRQLGDRYDDRETFDITDEYDVQDLLKSLLRIDFNDIRTEEWTPSYAGSSKRMDILLKKPKIVIEVKKTRKNLKDKEVGEQLTIDKAYYKNHQDCKTLYCFIYDPEERISNPIGLETDLKENSSGFKTIIRIIQS